MKKHALRPVLLASSALLLLALPAAAQRRSRAAAYDVDARYAAPSVRATSYGARGGYRPRCEPRVWVPGRYETVTRRVWVPERVERVWIEPVFGLRTDVFGVCVRVELSPGHYERVVHPGHYETRRERRFVPGHWVLR